MKSILSNYIAERKKSRAGRLRTLVALFLLSTVVASTVVWCLRFVGMTMTGIPTYEATPQTAAHRASPSEQQQNFGGGHISPSPSPTAATWARWTRTQRTPTTPR